MQVTINDVAREAGVSKATVSKYLNKTPYVAEKTSLRIAAAISRLEFRPNRVAQGLSNRRSFCIGVIVASITNPYYPELIASVEEIAAQKGYTLLLATSDGDPRRERIVVQAMRQRQVDGIVFASVRMPDQEVAHLKKSGVQVILASRHLTDVAVDYVVVDSYQGALMAARHLLDHGHRRIGQILGPQTIVQFQERLRGYHAALAAASIEEDPSLIVLTGTDVESGHEAAARLLALDRPPTAIVAATDTLAFGVLRYCRAQSLKVPDQLALIGFDNVPFGEIALVSLTTVDGQARAIGRQAARLLIDRIESVTQGGLERAEQIRITIEARLVLRRSCGCPEPGGGSARNVVEDYQDR